MPQAHLINQQILTRRIRSGDRTLATELVEAPVPALRPRELLVEVLFVPIHGSFWLASHPSGLHPRHDEFLQDGSFVFGNGGLGRVLSAGEGCTRIGSGDLVSVMGHIPCENPRCRGCRVLQRFTECDTGQGTILGHGKGAPDGTFARYCVLPEVACEPCFSKGEGPTEREAAPCMFGFLMADVRNALTRDPDTLRGESMLLVGAGSSGQLAAWLFLQASPRGRILVVDSLPDRLADLVDLAPEAIRTVRVPADVAEGLGPSRSKPEPENGVSDFVAEVAKAAQDHLPGGSPGLVFDASSGNTTRLWANSNILRPGTHCIPFGFGSPALVLDRACLQVSGLKVLTSRGVGSSENRRAAVDLVRNGASGMIIEKLIENAVRLDGLHQAMTFIRKNLVGPSASIVSPRAYMAPNPF